MRNLIEESGRSESESPAEAGPLNIIMDLFMSDGFLDNLLDAEGGIARGVEVSGLWVESTLSVSPVFELMDLNELGSTMFLLSLSPTLTMCPKEGTTLILMLLHEKRVTRLMRCCSGRTLNIFISQKRHISPLILQFYSFLLQRA